MRFALWRALALLPCLPAGALAQTGFVGPDGSSRYPGVTILCPAGTRATACNFGGGGGGGGNVSILLGGAPVGGANRFPTADQALDAIIGGGALAISGTVGLAAAVSGAPGAGTAQAVTVQGNAAGVPMPVSGTFWPSVQPVSAAALPLPAGAATAAAQTIVQSPPGTAASTAVTVQGAGGGVPVSVSCASGCISGNASVGSTGSAAPASATAAGFANAAGNLVTPVMNGDGGVPAHVTNFPATQQVSEAALDPLVSGGALAVAAAQLPLPNGAAKAAYQTNAQAPVAPAAPTATVSTLVGCVYNSTLPSFTNGQQGAVQCDAAGRPIVTTVPSANNVPGYLQAVSSGGAVGYRAINAAASAMAANVKAAGGMVYGFDVCNSGTGAVYFRLFNLATAPAVGGSTPAVVRLVPAGGCTNFSNDVGLTFATGIALDVTGGSLADADTTAVAAANQVVVQVYYK